MKLRTKLLLSVILLIVILTTVFVIIELNNMFDINEVAKIEYRGKNITIKEIGGGATVGNAISILKGKKVLYWQYAVLPTQISSITIKEDSLIVLFLDENKNISVSLKEE